MSSAFRFFGVELRKTEHEIKKKGKKSGLKLKNSYSHE